MDQAGADVRAMGKVTTPEEVGESKGVGGESCEEGRGGSGWGWRGESEPARGPMCSQGIPLSLALRQNLGKMQIKGANIYSNMGKAGGKKKISLKQLLYSFSQVVGLGFFRVNKTKAAPDTLSSQGEAANMQLT